MTVGKLFDYLYRALVVVFVVTAMVFAFKSEAQWEPHTGYHDGITNAEPWAEQQRQAQIYRDLESDWQWDRLSDERRHRELIRELQRDARGQSSPYRY